ncbi:hypothetical protein [uncultured Gilvimarinus sp.]|jgi:hypothetical protein|uniref:hypothetical protein n=1 Tax=uncultured Gilvimarinus sp. TaxID=1689143 RepID=UPI0030DD9F3D
MLLNAIAIPVIRQEMSSLQEWIKDCPTPGMNVCIYLSIDDQWQDSEKSELLKIHEASQVRDCPLQFIDCEIEASQSFYEKDKSIEGFNTNRYPYGKKSGPNIQFFRTLRKIFSIQPCTSGLLLLETDAHPILQNWVFELNQRTQWFGNNVYIAGSRPVIAETIGPIKNHINGNALYNLGNKNFPNFLEFWEEMLTESIKLNPDLAYDVAIEWSYHTSRSSKSNVFLKRLWANRSAYKYRRGCIDISSYILNVSGHSDIERAKIQIKNHLKQNSSTVILHGKYQNQSGEDIILQLKRTILKNQLSP